MAKLEERATQLEVQLGEVEGELANDVVDANDAGFEDAMTQVACMHPEMDLSPFAESK